MDESNHHEEGPPETEQAEQPVEVESTDDPTDAVPELTADEVLEERLAKPVLSGQGGTESALSVMSAFLVIVFAAIVYSNTSGLGFVYQDYDRIVDNDGLHAPKTLTGVAPLAAGWHPIRVEYFNKTGGAVLELLMGPLGEKPQPVARRALGNH